MLNEEGHVEADERDPERELAEALVSETPGHLRVPVVGAGHDREDRSTHQHVVEVGDDEVRVVELPVDREGGEEDAGDAADQEDDR